MPSPFVIRLLVIGTVLSAVAGFSAFSMHKHDQIAYNALQAEFDQFRGGVEALGRAAQKKAEETRQNDLKRKETADAQAARTVAALNARIASLRDSISAGRGGLSAPAPVASDPSRTCFDPAGLADALQSLDRGFLGIAAEGAEAVSKLDGVKRWAASK